MPHGQRRPAGRTPPLQQPEKFHKKFISTAPWRRRVALGTSVVFFYVNVLHAALEPASNFWQQRKRAVESSAAAPQGQGLLAQLPAAQALQDFRPTAAAPIAAPAHSFLTLPGVPAAFSLPLPLSAANLKSAYFPAQWKAGDPLVIQIQDVHRNLEAQRNIGAAVQELMKGGRVDLVALEGAFGPVDFSRFRAFPDAEAVRLTADYFLKELKMTGPIHAGFTAPAPLPAYVGVDDARLYEENVAAYRRSAARVEPYKKTLAQWASGLADEKNEILNPALQAFDGDVAAYRAGRKPLGDYVSTLAAAPAVPGANVRLFMKALEMEQGLDFKRVETERAALLANLAPGLDAAESSALLNAGMAYRLGRLRHGDFYVYLRRLCESNGVRLSAYPAMDAYVQYALLSDKINAEGLLAEVQSLEDGRYAALATTADEKNLVARARHLHLLGKLVDFALTPSEWREYKKLAAGQKAEGLDLASFEDFFHRADARDHAMTENLLKALAAGKSHAARSYEPGRRSSGVARFHKRRTAPGGVAVLVAGGFHSAGIETLLRSRAPRAAVVTLSPKFTVAELDGGSTYLSVFNQEKTPLQKLFEGEKLFVTELVNTPAMRRDVAALTAAAATAANAAVGSGNDLARALEDMGAADIETTHVAPGIAHLAIAGDVDGDGTPEPVAAMDVSRSPQSIGVRSVAPARALAFPSWRAVQAALREINWATVAKGAAAAGIVVLYAASALMDAPAGQVVSTVVAVAAGKSWTDRVLERPEDFIAVPAARPPARVEVGARNISEYGAGAYTGQTSKGNALGMGARFARIPDDGNVEAAALKIERAIRGEEPLAPIIEFEVPRNVWELGPAARQARLRADLKKRLAAYGLPGNAGALKDAALVPRLAAMDARDARELARDVRAIVHELYGVAENDVRLLLYAETRADLAPYLEFMEGVVMNPAPEGFAERARALMGALAAGQRDDAPFPWLVADLTQTHGEDLMGQAGSPGVLDILRDAAADPAMNGLTVVAVPTDLQLHDVGRALRGDEVYEPEALREPVPFNLALQNPESFDPKYLAAVKAAGFSYVLMGHSEARRHMGVTDAQVNQQAKAVLAAGLYAVIAIGEESRLAKPGEEGAWKQDLYNQTLAVLDGISLDDLDAGRVNLAYEPIASIGAGTSMTTPDIREASLVIVDAVRAHMRNLGRAVDEDTLIPLGILYGGSVSPSTSYEQPGGWGRDSDQPELLDRNFFIIGALVATRSKHWEDFIKIADRFAENVLAKGKDLDALTGANWKMFFEHLQQIERLMAENAKGMKTPMNGTVFIAVQASMGAPSARRFDFATTPAGITAREAAARRFRNEFFLAWQAIGQRTNLASAEVAVQIIQQLYREEAAELRKHGIPYSRVYREALNSVLFADKAVIAAANQLLSLRHGPLARTVAAIGTRDATSAAVLRDIIAGAPTFHHLTSAQIDAIYAHMESGLRTQYDKTLFRGILLPEETWRPTDEDGAAEALEYWDGVLSSAQDVVVMQTAAPGSLAERAAAVWDLYDIKNNPNLPPGPTGTAEVHLAAARQLSRDETISRNAIGAVHALGAFNEEVRIFLSEVGGDHPMLWELRRVYSGLLDSFSNESVSDQDIEDKFSPFREGAEGNEDWARASKEILDRAWDLVSAESEPGRALFDSPSLRRNMLKDLDYARRRGGVVALLVLHAKRARDAMKQPGDEPAAAVERPAEPLRPIGPSRTAVAARVPLAEPVELAVDVDGIFGRPTAHFARNAAVQVLRRALVRPDGRGINPNFNVDTIYGINNVAEYKALIELLDANPYQEPFPMRVSMNEPFYARQGRIRIDYKGETRWITVRESSSRRARLNAKEVILVTDKDPNTLPPSTLARSGVNVHVLNPELDRTAVSAEKYGDSVHYHKSALTQSVETVAHYLDRALAPAEGQHAFTLADVSALAPGRTHDLQKLHTEAARALSIPGVDVSVGEIWEAHTWKGAWAVQLNLNLAPGIEVDNARLDELLRFAHFEEPIYFPEGGWMAHSVSVQEKGRRLVIGKSAILRDDARHKIILRLWIPDWAPAEILLEKIENAARERVGTTAAPAAVPESLGASRGGTPTVEETPPAPPAPQKVIGIQGGDMVLTGALLLELLDRKEKDVVVKRVFINNGSVSNPLDTDSYQVYVRELFPGRPDVRLDPVGDKISINGSSPIEIIFGDGKKTAPDWNDVDAVVLADPKLARGGAAQKALARAKRVIDATDAHRPMADVGDMAEAIFSGDFEIVDRLVDTKTALNPFVDKGHDVVGLPAPMGNLVVRTPAPGETDVQSSEFNANVSVVTLLLGGTGRLTKKEVRERLRAAAAASDGRLALWDAPGAPRASPVLGKSTVFVDPDNILVDGRLVTLVFAYDYARFWADDVLRALTNPAPPAAEATARAERPASEPKPVKEFKVGTRNITKGTTIPAPPTPKVKKTVTGIHTHVGVDVSALPFDLGRRDPLDYFASSLIVNLMGDERMAVSFYGVDTAEKALALYRAIKKRLPRHLPVSLEGFAEGDNEKYEESWFNDGRTYIQIGEARVYLYEDSLLERPKGEAVDTLDSDVVARDGLDSVLIVSPDAKGAETVAARFADKGLNGAFHVNPLTDGLSLIEDQLGDALDQSGMLASRVRIISTKPGRKAELAMAGRGSDRLVFETPTQLEGDLHAFVVEFKRDVTREQVLAFVDDMEFAGVVEVTDAPIASLDLVDNPRQAVISRAQITGRGRLWSIPIWTSETGLAQAMIDKLVDAAVKSGRPAKSELKPEFLPAVAPLIAKREWKGMSKHKARILIHGGTGRTGGRAVEAAMGDPNIHLLGITLNLGLKDLSPESLAAAEAKVIDSALYMGNDTVYGRPGLHFEYGGWDAERKVFVIWAGTDETGWYRLDVYDGADPKSMADQFEVWNKRRYEVGVIDATGSGSHREKAKIWGEMGAAYVLFSNPGQGEAYLIIPGATKHKNKDQWKIILDEYLFRLGSCTTAALAVPLRVVETELQSLGVTITAVKAVTYHENTQDNRAQLGPLHPTPERMLPSLATAFSAGSGAASTNGQAVEEVAGRSVVDAIRDGNGGASVVNIRLDLSPGPEAEAITGDTIKEFFRKAILDEEMAEILGVHEEPFFLTSTEAKGYSFSALIDMNSVKVVKADGIVTVLFDSWYDNERGFSTRLIDAMKQISTTRRLERGNQRRAVAPAASLEEERLGLAGLPWILRREYTVEEYRSRAWSIENTLYYGRLALATGLAVGAIALFTGVWFVPPFNALNGAMWTVFFARHVMEWRGPQRAPFGNVAAAGIVAGLSALVLPALPLGDVLVSLAQVFGSDLSWARDAAQPLAVIAGSYLVHYLTNRAFEAPGVQSLTGKLETALAKHRRQRQVEKSADALASLIKSLSVNRGIPAPAVAGAFGGFLHVSRENYGPVQTMASDVTYALDGPEIREALTEAIEDKLDLPRAASAAMADDLVRGELDLALRLSVAQAVQDGHRKLRVVIRPDADPDEFARAILSEVAESGADLEDVQITFSADRSNPLTGSGAIILEGRRLGIAVEVERIPDLYERRFTALGERIRAEQSARGAASTSVIVPVEFMTDEAGLLVWQNDPVLQDIGVIPIDQYLRALMPIAAKFIGEMFDALRRIHELTGASA